MPPILDANGEKRAKEQLYRCLEELQSTKAALYLEGSEGSLQITTSYGFGRRDSLSPNIGSGHPLWDWVRRNRTSPTYLNNAHEAPELGLVLESAGTARIMTIPIYVGERFVGFVDARDKARKASFSNEDVIVARQIASSIEQLLRELGTFGDAAPPHSETKAAVATVQTPSPAPTPPAAENIREPLLHHSMIEEVAALARTATKLPGITVIAITVGEDRMARTLTIGAVTLDEKQREAVIAHQASRVQRITGRSIPPSSWSWEEESIEGNEKRCEEIRSALLHCIGQTFIAVSVVGPIGQTAADSVLTMINNHFRLALQLRNYQRAARNLARTLLEPGETAFPHLRQHSQAVSELAQKMAATLSLSESEEELVTLAGYLHDIGMRELDYQKIYRMERPGEMEKRLYQRHPTVGARIVEATEFPTELAAAIKHHHERWDGTGYPMRLAGRNIPLASRIIHLAEVYDVLTSPNSYRRTIGRDACLDIIRGESGKQFDPELVPLLQNVVCA